jgi:hypothetical protein
VDGPVLVSPRQVPPPLEQVLPQLSCTTVQQVLNPVLGQVVDLELVILR